MKQKPMSCTPPREAPSTPPRPAQIPQRTRTALPPRPQHPCRQNCPHRAVGCHCADRCAAWARYQAAYAVWKAQAASADRRDGLLIDYTAGAVCKVAHKKKREY